MIGTIVNTGAILTGSIVGSRINKGIKAEHQEVMFNAMGLAAFGLGINSVVQNMPNSAYPVLFIASLAIGSLIGELLDIDGHFKRLTDRFSGGNSLAQGLSTGILLFCVGTLSILGPIQSALYGDNTYLFTNATGGDITVNSVTLGGVTQNAEGNLMLLPRPAGGGETGACAPNVSATATAGDFEIECNPSIKIGNDGAPAAFTFNG